MLGDRAAALDPWERAVEVGFHEEKIDVYDSLIAPLKGRSEIYRGPRSRAAPDREDARPRRFSVIDEWIARGAPTTGVR